MGKDEPMQDRLSSWLRARAPALLAGSALVLSACATPPAAPLYQRLGGEAQIRAFMGRTLDRVAATYGAIIEAGVFKAASIKVAEAAKEIGRASCRERV